jgi:hypothetical protein
MMMMMMMMMLDAVTIDRGSGYSEASILLIRLGRHLKQLLEVSDASTSNSDDVDMPRCRAIMDISLPIGAKQTPMQMSGAYSATTRQSRVLKADGWKCKNRTVGW